ncbi:ATP-grasp domain-containing protein [Dethiosulfatarculus sandiegensis]|uniref:30S ribosomal protein S6 modification protein n=1 Tax=Dethiosulfatarculus sandiegensis TaxID=1429043 RepID=A0A0D2JRK9_9BACT|nr:RimK family alpha-L-glutamate ligase [Dethiosulfatarculus sandiegensis]KIX12135.1 30S ribosomal protein S6 modification protein [Dethiosulfatarculus sandiegensis]
MKAAICGKRGSYYVRRLQEALKARGIKAPCYSSTRLTARNGYGPALSVEERSFDDLDFLFVRAIPGASLEQIIYRMDALQVLERRGVTVVNPPKSIERTVDKYLTLSLLEDAGLPVPKTIVTEDFDQAMAAFEELGGDVVVKPIFGAEGRGIVRITEPDTAHRVFKALELGRFVYFLQEYQEHGHEDIRVFVIGGQVVGAMVRTGLGWKANMAQGATATPYDPDSELSRMSLLACETVGTIYAGVDILPLKGGGCQVIEVNGIPGWKGLAKATGVDVPNLLLDHLMAGKA